MKPIIKRILFLCLPLLIAALVNFAGPAHAAFNFQTTWPKSPMSTDIYNDADPTIAEGVKYFYEWGIGLGGIAVFIVLIMAGFQYITSVGDPGKMKEAFQRIEEAVIGLLILLSSYAILNLVGINLTHLQTNMFTPKFDNPVTTCSSASNQPADECCKNSDGSPIPNCQGAYYRCISGTCQPNMDKEKCDHVELFYAEGGSDTINKQQLKDAEQIQLDSGVTIDRMELYAENGELCYDPASEDAKDPATNPVCSCGIQLFTKTSTTSSGGLLTNPCENNTEIQFAGDNTTLKSYTKGKRVVCVMFSESPSIY